MYMRDQSVNLARGGQPDMLPAPSYVFTIDVWHSWTFPVTPDQDWRRYIISARDATEAELLACQMAARYGTPTRSTVIDWSL